MMQRILRFRTFLLTLAFLLVFVGSVGAISVSSGASAENAPREYVLSAAYPNPFNPSTTFTLTVQTRQNVRVQVFNVLGQPVRDLFDGVLEADTPRSFTFDASGLPTGIYFYRVSGETFTAARQVTFME